MSVIYLKNNQCLQVAIDNATPGSTIILQPRTYREKIIIRTKNITIKGQNGSAICYGDYANKIHIDGLEYNTFRTYTVQVLAENVTIKDLEITNDAFEPMAKGQAVALSVYANNFYGENLTLKSMQDTLFLGPLPDELITRYYKFLPDDERFFEGEALSYFKDCKIYGSIDYVFGCGQAYFEKCSFINVDDGRSTAYVCAPAHSLKQKIGFVFFDCDFSASDNLKATTYLARPWRDYGKCSFLNCSFNNHISTLGFNRWGDTYRNKTARFEVFNCTKLNDMVDWAKELDDKQANQLISALENIKANLCKN